MVKLTRSEQKKQDIVNAAKKMFKSHGVKTTSMDKLAEAAHVSKRTVYNHFKTKEELVMYLVTELWLTAMQDDTCTYNRDEPLVDQLFKLVLNEIQFLSDSDYLDMARVAFGHFFYQPEVIKNEIDKVSTYDSAIHKWLVAADSDSQLQIDNIEKANDQLHSLIKGSCFWPQLVGLRKGLTTDEQTDLAKEAVALFMAKYQVVVHNWHQK